MNTEPQAAPVAEALNTATESTQPEVVTQETEQAAEPQVSEKDERDRAIARMEKRINRKHAEAATANERARSAEERLAQYERSRPAEERQKVEVDPYEIERVVETRAQQRLASERLAERCNNVVEKGRKEFPDFTDAVTSVGRELPLFDRNGAPTPALEVILEAEDASALLHYLGKNPDVVEELADLTPIQLTRRLDRIEREFKQPPRPSAAPKPHEPEKAGSSSSSMPDAARDPKAFIAWRNEQERAKRKR